MNTLFSPLSFLVCFFDALMHQPAQPVIAFNKRGIGIARVGIDSADTYSDRRDLLSLAWVTLAIACMLAIVWGLFDPIGSSIALAMATPVATRRKIDPPTIEYGGSHITLPDDPQKMKLDDAIGWLTKMRDDQEQVIMVREEVPGYDPFDVAHALMLAIRKVYGFAQTVPPSWFENPPTMVNVKTGVDDTVQVPWGKFALPNVSGYVQTSVKPRTYPPVFVLGGETKKKDAARIQELMHVTRAFLKTDSIYQSKAVRFTIGEDDPTPIIDFVDVSGANPEHLIYSADIAEQVKTTIFTPLLKRELCKAIGVPFKRGVCLMGPYGTGKTLAMYVAAKHAIANGVTVVIVDDASHLTQALKFARQYAPSLVVCEDVDRVTRERDDTCDDIMDALDGTEAKDRDVMVLFTSNDGEAIHEAMRRPGRIDTFIKVLPPDAAAVERLLRLYGKGRIAPSENLTEVCALLAGQIPAVIREVVERAKLAAIARVDDRQDLKSQIRDASELWSEDLMISARRMLMQIDLFSDKKDADVAIGMAVAARHLSSMGTTLQRTANELHARN